MLGKNPQAEVRVSRSRALLGVIALVLIVPTESAAASRRQIGARSPRVASGAGQATSAVRAIVTVTVDPQGAPTAYTLQYGTSTDYSLTTAIKTVSATSGRRRYQIALRGLVPSTVYHYRVVAANVYGSTLGRDESFGTWPAVQIAFGSRGVISKNNITSKPRGPRRNKAPIGWVMAIHGGGWQYVGPLAVRAEQARTGFFTRLGWAADNVDYRKGEHSFPDVLAAYDALRRRVGSKTPICVIGQSAGGHLAQLVAEYRPSVDCVISEAGPTDLVRLRHQNGYTPRPPKTASFTPESTYQYFIVTSFGVDRAVLRKWSPVHRARAIHAHLLLGTSTHDEIVPLRQMRELRTEMRAANAPGTIKTVRLAGAKTPSGQAENFTHASVTATALIAWKRDERRLLARTARSAHRNRSRTPG